MPPEASDTGFPQRAGICGSCGRLVGATPQRPQQWFAMPVKLQRSDTDSSHGLDAARASCQWVTLARGSSIAIPFKVKCGLYNSRQGQPCQRHSGKIILRRNSSTQFFSARSLKKVLLVLIGVSKLGVRSFAASCGETHRLRVWLSWQHSYTGRQLPVILIRWRS